MKLPRVPFTFLLPLLSLSIWLVLVAVPVTLSYITLLEESRGAPVRVGITAEIFQQYSRNQYLQLAVANSTASSAHFIEAVNFPAFSGMALVDGLTRRWPNNWAPEAMSFEEWNAVTFPFYSLPFWWLVGLGLDALLTRRRLRWPSLLLGTLLCGLSIFLLVGLSFTRPADGESNAFVLCGLSLWSVLFATFPATWIRQRRLFVRHNLPDS